MSKKKKVSSGKTKAKSASKPAKKKAVKPTKAAPKKKVVKKTKVKPKAKPVKASKKASKPAKKVAVKKTVAKKVSKTTPKISAKDFKNKTIVKGSIKEYSKPIEEIKNPVLLKKEDKPIPEFKPIIKPTVKEEVKQKDNFPTALKSTSANSFLSAAKKNEAYSVKPEKEPPGKFEIEMVIRASAELLYEFLVTPSGLSEWFCDDVNIRNGIYTFIWDGQMQQARLLKTIEEQLVRYQWVEKTDGSYFEFKIQKDELTNDISLIITDFAIDKGEQESSKLLWHSQIDKLLHVMGSFF